jgi:hypothetical protein
MPLIHKPPRVGRRGPSRPVTATLLCAALLLGSCSDDEVSPDDPSEAGDDDGSGATADEQPAEQGAAEAEEEDEEEAVTELPEPVAEVTGPIEGAPANAMPASFADRGYVEEEYFLSGEATAYAPVGELGLDGAWEVEPAGTSPYTTRVVVRRPADEADFSGTVYVEWFNVTAGVDGDPDFGLVNPVVFDEGSAYVAVSAQAVAVEGGEGLTLEIEGVPEGLMVPLKQSDPERYGDLAHPGDTYSYDMFAQVAQVVRSGALLEGEGPDHVIALGESQSAARLVTFVNAIQPVTDAFDGFLIHRRGGGGAPLGDDAGAAESFTSGGVHIRADLDVPVLQFETETDLIGLGFLSARQDDTDRIVTWEAAGTAHADASLLAYGSEANADSGFDIASVCPGINDGPQAQVVRAALAALSSWVTQGTVPPSAPRLEVVDGAIQRDGDGIALGGIRTPDVDAPIAVNTGESTADSIICFLFGSSAPLPPERIAELYPTHDDYVAAVTTSADEALEAGFILPDDRDAFVDEAEAAPIPG